MLLLIIFVADEAAFSDHRFQTKHPGNSNFLKSCFFQVHRTAPLLPLHFVSKYHKLQSSERCAIEAET